MSTKNKPSSKTCLKCQITKPTSNFYASSSPLHGDGRLPYCKECIMSMLDISNMENVKSVLRQIDKPWIASLWAISLEKNTASPFGNYIKMINSLPQYRGMTSANIINDIDNERIREAQDAMGESKIDRNAFVLTGDIVDRWGVGYQPIEYEAFEKKYALLKNNYPEKTAMHTEALLNYIRYRVKEEIATASNNVAEAKKWSEMAQTAATAAKINPSQLSKADLSDGLSTFSELSQALEKEVDIINILPRFKYRPNDALDFNIWCYVNYIRDLQALPPCKYEDVYAFYDRRKQDYINQYGDPYGIFTDDPSEKNRDNIIKFLKEDGE